MTVNMGPQHPSTHGVLRLVLELDGETVLSAAPTIGYLHTGIEKTAEQKKWQQVVPLIERTDYLGAQSNSLSYALSVEKLLGLEMPDRVKWIRVLLAELQRINSHLVWLGTHGMEVGAVSVMLYCFRERELLDRMPIKLREYEDLLTGNPIFTRRTQGVGFFPLEQCEQYALMGPMSRAAGSTFDVRKVQPYSGYETFEFDVPRFEGADVFDRYRIRLAEMHQSIRICNQALERITPPPKDKVYTEMEALIQHFLIHSQGFTVPAGDAFVPVEGPRGQHGVLVVSDGTNRPVRVHLRSPSLAACQAMEPMVVGALLADVVAIIGSTDIVMGDVDR
jgi:NADH-quinone oxidoreductase subunit D